MEWSSRWDLSTGPDAVTIQDSIGYIRKVDNPVTGGRFIIKETNVEYLAIANKHDKFE